jgi:predicted DNA-binding transcriptional regulator AlpA
MRCTLWSGRTERDRRGETGECKADTSNRTAGPGLPLSCHDAVIEVDALLDRFAELVAAKLAAKLGNGNGNGHAVAESDVLLTAPEAAQRLGVKAAWLYDRANTLPFTVRLPNSRAVRFSERGLDKWLGKRGTR